MSLRRAGRRRTLLGGFLALATLLGATGAQAQEHVRVLLDWSWLPYHAAFLIAKARGYYKDAGLDVDIEQGRAPPPRPSCSRKAVSTLRI